MSEATNTPAVAVTYSADTKLSLAVIMAISERVKTGKKDDDGNDIMENKEIAKVSLPCPSLSDFGINAAIEMDGNNPKLEDGVPVYVDPVADWLMYAIANQVKAQSRNKFTKGALKDGNTLATNFAELIAVGERTGEAMKARHDAKKSFAAYLEAQNKSAVVVKVLSDLFHNESSIVTAKDNFVDALESHLGKWIPSLTAVDAGRFEKKISSIDEQLKARKIGIEDLK